MTTSLQQSNFVWLTFSLAALMLLSALTDEFPGVDALYLIKYANIVLLLIALQSLNSEKPWHRGLLGVIATLLLIVVFQGITSIRHLELAYLLFLAAFYIAAALRVRTQVLMTGTIDAHIMFGAIALYLLLGLIWSAWYGILLQFIPNAFEGINFVDWETNGGDLTYFSFVTLTTLGYGDISPISPLAKVLVVLEAMAGMFFLAIVVASLVGAMRNDSRASG